MKSFADHPRSKYWDYSKNSKRPEDISYSGRRLGKFWFICGECNHSFYTGVSPIVYQNCWCPYCSNNPKLCEDNNCKICYERSFESHPKAKFWDYSKNTKNPRQVCKNSKYKPHFMCEQGHSFSLHSLSSAVGKNQWCPQCKNKTEKKVGEYLYSNYKDVIHQFKGEWSKNPDTGIRLSYDFYIPEYNTIIEVDGIQHQKFIPYFHKTEEYFQKLKKRDELKEELASNAGYNLIRLCQLTIHKSEDNYWKDCIYNTLITLN